MTLRTIPRAEMIVLFCVAPATPSTAVLTRLGFDRGASSDVVAALRAILTVFIVLDELLRPLYRPLIRW